MRGDSKYEYRVRYRRTKWSSSTKTKHKYFQRHGFVLRYLEMILKWGEAEINVDRRRCGDWEPFQPADHRHRRF